MSYIRGEDRHQGSLFPVRPDELIPEDGQNQNTQDTSSFSLMQGENLQVSSPSQTLRKIRGLRP